VLFFLKVTRLVVTETRTCLHKLDVSLMYHEMVHRRSKPLPTQKMFWWTFMLLFSKQLKWMWLWRGTFAFRIVHSNHSWVHFFCNLLHKCAQIQVVQRNVLWTISRSSVNCTTEFKQNKFVSLLLGLIYFFNILCTHAFFHLWTSDHFDAIGTNNAVPQHWWL